MDSKALFSGTTASPSPPECWGLQLHDPTIVKACLQYLHKQLDYDKVLDKLDKLNKIPPASWSTSDTLSYDHLDTLITESMRNVAPLQKRTKNHMKGHPFNPMLLIPCNIGDHT